MSEPRTPEVLHGDLPTTFRIGSLFSGSGAFDAGVVEGAEGDLRWLCEIEPNCQAVLRRHYPEVPLYDDVRAITRESVEPVELMVGGFPCQDLTLAGARRGLAGERSGLFFEFARCIADIAPRWFLMENVPGLLSSREGADFGIVLGTLSGFWPEPPADGWGNAGVCVGDKASVAWRVLDATAFGVPQRRRRVFIVGSSRFPSGPTRALFESEASEGNLRQRIAVREETPPSHRKSPAVAIRLRNGRPGGGKGPLITADLAPTLLKSKELIVMDFREDEPRARYLSIEEEEALQGLPPGWTAADTVSLAKRYWMVGGAVPLPVAKWLGTRIRRADRELTHANAPASLSAPLGVSA